MIFDWLYWLAVIICLLLGLCKRNKVMERGIYRIVKLEGDEKYKVQKFMPERRKFWFIKVQAGWKDMPYHEYSGKSYTHRHIREAEAHIVRLKQAEIVAKDEWIPVKSDL